MKRKKFAVLLATAVLALSCVGCAMTNTTPKGKTTAPIMPTNPVTPDVIPDVIPDTTMPRDKDLVPNTTRPKDKDVLPNTNSTTVR